MCVGVRVYVCSPAYVRVDVLYTHTPVSFHSLVILPAYACPFMSLHVPLSFLPFIYFIPCLSGLGACFVPAYIRAKGYGQGVPVIICSC